MADEVDNTLAREEDASPAPDVADEASAEVDATAPAEPLPEVDATAPAEPLPEVDATAPAEPLPEATKPMPEAVEVPDYDDAAEPAPTPQLADIGADLASWAKGRAAKAGAFLSAHRLLVVLVALVCVGAILAAVLFGINSSQTPPDSLITADVRERLTAPSHTANAYEVDEPLVLQSVDVGSKRPSGTRRDGCEVNAEVVFANSGMETRAEAQLTYVRKGDTWTCTAASTSDASHHAIAGVSQERVLRQSADLLQAADKSDEGTLTSLYRDASVELVSENFVEDAQTDSLILRFESQGTFVNYTCDLTVHFRFAPASGAWELTEALVSDNAYDLSFSPLEGTWKGTFTSQQSSSQKCLAAQEAGLTVVITQAQMGSNGNATIAGTVTGMVHLHADLTQDTTTTEGDQLLEAVPFTGRISSGDVEQDILSLLAGNNPKQEQAGIVFDCATQDLANGTVTLTLTFGTAEAPDAAAATLTTTHSYEDYLLIIPYQREARFSDHFTLEKVG